ncbi:MAG: cation diffusion facilitator family transporter [Shewanella sp.]
MELQSSSNTETEQRILRRSILCTLTLALSGITFGIISGSMAIVFDGMFSALDAAMCGLSLLVSRLLAEPISRRFQYGFWHIEPLVLAFNGSMLTLLCIYAFINAVKGILDGGSTPEAGWALLYTTVASVFCFGLYFKQQLMNRKIRSQLIALDSKSWLMSGIISSAIFLSFIFSFIIKSTRYEHLSVYVDSFTLAILALALIPVPIKTVKSAVSEVLRMTPENLDANIESIMARLMLEYGFLDYSNYATRVGRGLFIEIQIVIPPEMDKIGVHKFDQIRDQISEAIGEDNSHRWLSISFTHDPKWL